MKAKSEKIQKVFECSSKDELISFLTKELKRGTELTDRFLQHFSRHWQTSDADSYQERLQSLAQGHLSSGKKAVLVSVPKLSPWFENAEKHLLEGQYGEAWLMIKSMIDVYGRIDGSADPVREAMTEVMNSCTRALFDLFRQCQVPQVKEEILQFAYRSVLENKYPYWNLEERMFDFLLAQEWSNDYRRSLKTLSVDRMQEADNDRAKTTYAIRYCKTCDSSEEEQRREVLNRYQHLPQVLQYHFLWAQENQYWEEAAEVAGRGLRRSLEGNDLQKVIEWQHHLFNIAKAKGDIQSQKQYAYQLYLSKVDHDREIYSELKHLNLRDWILFRDRLLEDLLSDNPYNVLKRAEIYHAEDLNTSLLSLLEEYPFLVDQFGRKLQTIYPERILEVYRVCLETMLAKNSGRKTYRKFCYKLVDIAENIPGGRDFCEGMIIRMRLEYKHRKAFIDELDQISKNYGWNPSQRIPKE